MLNNQSIPEFYTDPLSLDFTSHPIIELADICMRYIDEHQEVEFASFIILSDQVQ